MPRRALPRRPRFALSWSLIDLDASCSLGEEAGCKKTSSGCFTPRLARNELARTGRGGAVVARPEHPVTRQ